MIHGTFAFAHRARRSPAHTVTAIPSTTDSLPLETCTHRPSPSRKLAAVNKQRHQRPTSLSLLPPTLFLSLQRRGTQPKATMDQQQQQGPDAAAARRMATLASHLRPHPASQPQVSQRAPRRRNPPPPFSGSSGLSSGSGGAGGLLGFAAGRPPVSRLEHLNCPAAAVNSSPKGQGGPPPQRRLPQSWDLGIKGGSFGPDGMGAVLTF